MKVTLKVMMLLLAGILLGSPTKAQLTGAITVPSSPLYPTLKAVIDSLNSKGIGAGGVIINITAGNPQTAPAGGYNLGSEVLNASTSATKTIRINGNSNMITANVGIGALDAIFRIKGTDYVTIDKLNLQEDVANTTGTTQMEWGYALLKYKNTIPYDGAQHNTISNCTITLNNTVTASRGIYSGNHVDTNATALTIVGATASDANSYNSYYGNTITAVVGIYTTGLGLGSFGPLTGGDTLYDVNTSVGMPTGNTFTFAGPAFGSYAVYHTAVNGVTVSNNTCTSIPSTAGGITGVYVGYGKGNLAIEKNIFNLNSNGTNGSVTGVMNSSYSDATATFTLNDNTFNINYLTSTSGSIYGLNNSYTFGTINITNNKFANINFGSAVTSNSATLIRNDFVSAPTVNITGNTFSNIVCNGTKSGLIVISGSGSAASGQINISGNTISGIKCAYNFRGISYSSNATQKLLIKNNKISNVRITSAPAAIMYGIYAMGAGGASEVALDTVTDMRVDSGTFYGIATTMLTPAIYNNIISKDSMTSGSVYGLYVESGNPSLYANNVNNMHLSGGNGFLYGMYTSSTVTGASAYNNFIADFTIGPSTGAFIWGMYLLGKGTHSIYHNTVRISGLTTTAANLGATGITYTDVPLLDLRNNILYVDVTPIGDPNTSGFVAALYRGVGTAGVSPANFQTTSNGNIYYAPNVVNSYLYAEKGSGALVNAFNLTNDPNFNTTCGLYKQFMSRDKGSVTEQNLSAGTLANTYRPSGATYAKSIGVPTDNPQVTTDYAGAARTAADAGALQFAGTPVGGDITPPSIVFTPLPKALYCGIQTVAATITDASGVNVASNTKPRMYYKKAGEANTFGTYPADNVLTFNGWKYVEATGTAPNFTFTIEDGKLTAPIVANDSITYFILAQDNATMPNVGNNIVRFAAGYCPTSVNLVAAAGPTIAMPASNGFKVLPLTDFATVAKPTLVCGSAPVTLDITPSPIGLAIQWQQGTTTYTDISSATTTPYTTAAVTNSTNFRAQLKCAGNTVTNTTAAAITVSNPLVISSNGETRCGSGTFNLSATASAGATLNWYTDVNDTKPVATGPTYTTPVVTSTTNFYVAASINASTITGAGRVAPAASATGNVTANSGLIFDAYQPYTINTVDVYPTDVAGTMTVELVNSTGTVLQTSNVFNLPAGTGTSVGNGATPVTLTLNFNVPAGTGYRLRTTPTVKLIRETGGITYPMPLGNYGAITSGLSSNNTTTFYPYFYNIKYTTYCESPRIAVAATINSTAPAFTVTGAQTVCNNAVATLTVTSPLTNFDTYTWAPTANLYTDAAGTVPYTGGSAATVYLKITTAGDVTITASALNNTSQCTNIANSVVTVQPGTVTVEGNPPTVCGSGTTKLMLKPASGYGASTIQWQNSTDNINFANISGATSTTYTTPVITSKTYYKTLIKNSAGATCLQPVITIDIANPQVTGNTPATTCGPGAVTLSATPNPGSTIYWYAAATGGTYIATGNSYITPVLNTTTTYYATAVAGALPVNGAKLAPGGTASEAVGPEKGLVFDALQAFTLATVDVYPNGAAGNITVDLVNSTGTVLQSSGVINTPTGIGSTAYTIYLGFNVPVGTGHRLIISNGNVSLAREVPGTIAFPYAVGSYATVTSGSPSSASGYYYYFYNWRINGCESARTPVTATVSDIPTVNTTVGGATTFCEGDSVAINANTDVGYIYQWRKNGGDIAGATISSYTVKASGDYKVVITNSGNCSDSSATTTVTVNPLPTPVITRNGLELSTTAGYSSYQWYRDGQAISGATSNTHTVTQDGVYTVSVTDVNSCANTSSAEIVNNVGVPYVHGSSIKIDVYPNPATNMVHIAASIPVTTIVSSIDGKILLQQQNAHDINISELADGVYMVVLRDANGALLKTEKLVKKSN